MSTRMTVPTVTCYCDRCDAPAPTTATTAEEAIRQVCLDPSNQGHQWYTIGAALVCADCAQEERWRS